MLTLMNVLKQIIYVDDVCNRWTDLFLNTARTHIPNKVVTIRPNDSPWYTNELRNKKRCMLRNFKKYKHSNKDTDWDNYKNSRNEYQYLLTKAEQDYKKSLCDSLSSNRNCKKWWSTVKWLLGKGGDTSYPSLTVNNKSVTDNKEKAEEFNNFFLSHSNIDDSLAHLPNDINFEDSLEYIVATEHEVFDLIKALDTSKASGPGGISPKLLYGRH